jgi:cap1 methyltransferase
VDGTGDIYNWDNVIALQDMIYNDDVANINNHDGEGASHHQEYGKVHLVVVDGGFDAQRNTEHQEEVSLKLVVNETAAALSILCTGGTFVIKMFGFQTSIVRTMMTHLYMMFHRIIALKPISSRPASAERYVVCYGYHGHPPNWSGQHWCNDLYMSRPCTVSNLPSSDINYIDKEVELLRYLDEFDRDMYMLNLKASFAILSYIERRYLQQVICMNEGENSDGSDVDVNDPYDLVEDNDVSDEAFRVNIPMYRMAWRLER